MNGASCMKSDTRLVRLKHDVALCYINVATSEMLPSSITASAEWASFRPVQVDQYSGGAYTSVLDHCVKLSTA
jgi:hypothetical protein